MKRWVWLLFALVCVAQWLVPASMLHRHETTLRNGEVYRFRTAPVDPYDAFRGRYVALAFEQSVLTNIVAPTNLSFGAEVHAELERDEDGFARIVALHESTPERPSIPVRFEFQSESEVRISLPFDRFYLEETRAPEAENAHRMAMMTNRIDTFAVVRVYRHFPVLEDLVINGQSVHALHGEE